MKADYKEELEDTLNHAKKIRKLYKNWESSKTGYKYPEKGIAYKNYLLICCYGKIEHVFKNIVADYFISTGMPLRCVRFGNKIRERLPGSMARDVLNKFIKEECSEEWFKEIKHREDTASKCSHNKSYSFKDAYIGLTSLTNIRHNFAHGTSTYTGNIDDIITYYLKSIAWLYEIDDIISYIG
jgi:hypothetical protein